MRQPAPGTLWIALLLAGGAAWSGACADSNPADPAAATGDPRSASSTGGNIVDPGCEGPLGPPRDPATLPACCPDHGGAHCVESVPSELASYVESCEGGGYCVPDPFIATGGVFTPAECVAFDDSPGVCLSACIPKIGQVASILSGGDKTGACGPGELCAPCEFGGMATGACEIKFSCDDASSSSSGTGGDPPPECDDPNTCVYDCPEPFVDPASFDPCPLCGGGRCVPNVAIGDPALVAMLEPCSADESCVPEEFIEKNGKFVPETCKSIGGFEGRCLSKCIPQIAEQAAQLPVDVCPADTHVCAPCYDPFTGEPTGACTQSCDPGPVEPAQTFPKCCADLKGTCIPASNVPPEQKEKLGEDVCPQTSGEMLCVPDPFLQAQQNGVPFYPQQCETSFWLQLFFGNEYAEGACLPECIPEVADAPLVNQGDCPDEWKCVPCINPTTGQSSGACEPQGG